VIVRYFERIEATIERVLWFIRSTSFGLIPEVGVPKPSVTVDSNALEVSDDHTRAAEEGQKLADASGGVFYSIKRIEDLQKAYDDVVAQMRTAYTITYDSTANSSGQRRVRSARES